ncbi:LOW QUALITY PROTEIN: elongin-C [Cucumis sativus]|uniref:LOW QUALITY PROTEIN: elongin-C n=1 Tax=Cucumis sativus TaxID=3659 RepID=UPI0012F4F67E|nr:LOW QUALITY PROTEIN: elongin-C [Cucumis sativus]
MKKEDTVKLISAEGFEFVIHKDAAMVSQTIRNMLTSPGNFAESQHREVTFPEISTTILEKICQYFHWNLPFVSGKETEFPIEPELTLELMMAANYLHT